MSDFSHIDRQGQVRMVDVTGKAMSTRTASAQSIISMHPETYRKIHASEIKKGNVLEAARLAGIMAAKNTAFLIPMCHPLNLSHVQVDFFPDPSSSSIRIETSARVVGQTGVEMEALTAAAVAALTIYDMCKSYDKEMMISDIYLLEKSGGKSGKYIRNV